VRNVGIRERHGVAHDARELQAELGGRNGKRAAAAYVHMRADVIGRVLLVAITLRCIVMILGDLLEDAVIMSV